MWWVTKLMKVKGQKPVESHKPIDSTILYKWKGHKSMETAVRVINHQKSLGFEVQELKEGVADKLGATPEEMGSGGWMSWMAFVGIQGLNRTGAWKLITRYHCDTHWNPATSVSRKLETFATTKKVSVSPKTAASESFSPLWWPQEHRFFWRMQCLPVSRLEKKPRQWTH